MKKIKSKTQTNGAAPEIEYVLGENEAPLADTMVAALDSAVSHNTSIHEGYQITRAEPELAWITLSGGARVLTARWHPQFSGSPLSAHRRNTEAWRAAIRVDEKRVGSASFYQCRPFLAALDARLLAQLEHVFGRLNPSDYLYPRLQDAKPGERAEIVNVPAAALHRGKSSILFVRLGRLWRAVGNWQTLSHPAELPPHDGLEDHWITNFREGTKRA